ncbi:hypothetical protein V502_01186 [Pseudogymnoascus sp. VKM F-4520 (FW-2644)]|nr:hypothetical protein V502_01186 [Pseudogymnoascus sp. VKM F-4520 (FW-2644)]
MEMLFLRQGEQHGTEKRSHWPIVVIVSVQFDGSLDVVAERAKAAWTKMRYKHPLIASHVVGDCWVYTTESPEEQAHWLRDTFRVEHRPFSPQYDIEMRGSPKMRYLSHTNEFIFHAAHHYIDGLGAALLMRDFLRELGMNSDIDPANIICDLKVQNLPSSMWEATKIPPSRKQRMRFLPASLQSVRPDRFISLPNCSAKGPGANAFRRLRISRNDAIGIANAAKEVRCSVAQFIHAALIQAAKLQGNYEDGSYFLTFLVKTLRGFSCDPAISEAAAVRVGLWPICLEIFGFEETIRRLKQAESQYRKNARRLLSDMPANAETVFSDFGSHLFGSFLFTSSGDTSQLFESSYGAFKFEGITMMNPSMNKGTVIYLQTVREEFEFSICYNEAFHAGFDGGGFLEVVKRVLKKESSTVSRM